MNEKAFLLLILLNICHWAADYTHLSRPNMLQAKRLGYPLFPIFQHAFIHAWLMSIVVTLFLKVSHIDLQWQLFLLQLLSHFAIDTFKGRMNAWFPSLHSPANILHWYVFGADQFLHQAVLILITYLALK